MSAGAQAQTQAQQNQQLNMLARQAIRAKGVRRIQQIFDSTYTTNIPSQIQVIPRNVGLVMGFWVKVVASITNNGAAHTIVPTDFGPSNLVSQFQLNDLQNNTRIQTTGFHEAFLNSWKTKRAFASALTGIRGTNTGNQTTANTYFGQDSPIGYGSNWTEISAPASIAAAGGSGTLTMWWYIPLAYNPDAPNVPDFRGAVYANVVNATWQLLVNTPGTYGNTLVAAFGTDSTQAVMVQSAAEAVSAVISSYELRVYQDYYDQLPTGNAGVLLPILDLATIYERKYTNQTSITVAQDFPYQYANFRQFLSTFVVYVNTALTGARGTGADVNYWALQAANFSNIWKMEPNLISLMTRQHIGLDYPPGCYFFDSRNRPISTTQYGNMELNLNAATAGTGAYELVMVEDFAIVQTLSMAGSLAAS
jgi:P3 major capsid protein